MTLSIHKQLWIGALIFSLSYLCVIAYFFFDLGGEYLITIEETDPQYLKILQPPFFRAHGESSGVAMILDSRSNSRLIKVTKDWLLKLPADWKVQFFHSPYNEQYLNKHLKGEIAAGKVVLTQLPYLHESVDKHEYSRIYTQPSLWRSVIHENIITFQMDTAICTRPKISSNGVLPNNLSFTDILQFDYVGAPWDLPPEFQPPASMGLVGNGGLSFRKRSVMISILEPLGENPNEQGIYEDTFIVQKLIEGNYKIADVESAKRFSVETMYFPNPFAVHAPWLRKFTREQQLALRKHCPEVISLAKEIKDAAKQHS